MIKVPELPPAQYLRSDIFPATVMSPALEGGVVDRVRVIITDAHVHLFKLTPTGDIELLFSAELDSVEKAPKVGPRGVRVITAEGDQLEAKRSSNCGCGMTRLKSTRIFNPPLPLQAL